MHRDGLWRGALLRLHAHRVPLSVACSPRDGESVAAVELGARDKRVDANAPLQQPCWLPGLPLRLWLLPLLLLRLGEHLPQHGPELLLRCLHGL